MLSIFILWTLVVAIPPAEPMYGGGAPEGDTARARTYEDQAEIEWMLERASAAERPVVLHHELLTGFALDGPDVFVDTVFGRTFVQLTPALEGEYIEEILADGLVRSDLYVSVSGGTNRTSGEFRWYSLRDTVLSLYLSV